MEQIQQSLHVLSLSSSSLFLLLSTSLLLLLSFFYLKNDSKTKSLLLPPSPPRLPIIGHLHLLSSLPHYPLKDLSKKYGPVMLLHFGKNPTLIISSVAAAQEVVKNQDLNFATRPFSPAGSVFTYGARNVSFAPFGEHWRQAKKISVANLFTGAKVQSFRRIREEEVSIMVGKILSSSSSGTLNLSEILYGFSSGVICRVVAGDCVEREERSRRFREIIDEASALISGPSLEDILPRLGWIIRVCGGGSRLKKLAKNRDELLEEILVEHERKAREKREEDRGGEGELDFVDLLLRSGDLEGGYAFSRDDIKAIFIDLIAAGTDTTYAVLEWTMAELIKNPTLLQATQKELRLAGAGEDALAGAPFLQALVKEVLRLHMPAPLLLPRQAISQTQLLGYDVPAGTQVFINAWAMATDNEWWDSPEKFSPERFSPSSSPAPADFRGSDMQFLPFGAGRRMCPGIGFALCEIELALAGLLYHFDWKMPEGEAPQDLDMAGAPGFTIRKKTPLRLVAVPRAPVS